MNWWRRNREIRRAGENHLFGGPAEDPLGKIMRRLLRDIAEGRALGNVTTLADPSVIEALKSKYATES